MPQKEQTITLQKNDLDSNMSNCYEAFKLLGWPVQSAGQHILSGVTIKKWNSNPQQIIISIEGNLLTVTSKMIKGESMDIAGKNKKNIDAFFASFNKVENSITPNISENNKKSIDELRIETAKATE